MSTPISPPRKPWSWLDDLQLYAPEVYAQLQDVKHDSPQDYRDGHEAKKKPHLPMDPLKGPQH